VERTQMKFHRHVRPSFERGLLVECQWKDGWSPQRYRSTFFWICDAVWVDVRTELDRTFFLHSYSQERDGAEGTETKKRDPKIGAGIDMTMVSPCVHPSALYISAKSSNENFRLPFVRFSFSRLPVSLPASHCLHAFGLPSLGLSHFDPLAAGPELGPFQLARLFVSTERGPSCHAKSPPVYTVLQCLVHAA